MTVDFGFVFLTILVIAIVLWALRKLVALFSTLIAVAVIALLVIYLIDAVTAFDPTTLTFIRPLLIQQHIQLVADWLTAWIQLLFPTL